MFRTVPPAVNFSINYTKSKCAEIHYQSSTFSILCILCGLKTLAFSDFCNHFYNHYETFINALTDKEELSINSESEITGTNFNRKRDPLKLEVEDVTKDSEEVLKILRSENDNTITRTSAIEISNNEEHGSAPDFGAHPAECDSDDSTKEVKKDRIKLEQTVFNHTEALKVFQDNAGNNENFSESDSDKLNSISIEENVNENVDWSKSYEPNLLKNNDKRPYKARNTPNMCTYCGKTFRRRLQLDTHLNIHTGSKPHQCEICGRLFRAVTTLARHLNTHEDREVFSCKFCAKSFSRRAAMLSHELRHTQQRRIPCDECDKFFYTVNQMDTHKRKVHNKADDASLPFQCNLCPKRYRSASMLSTHKYKKHYKTAKIICDQCGKKFVSDQQLETHKAIHICSIPKQSLTE